ncbi:MAG: DJ-1/PfpI family protein [Candidatus Margulisiibacteriota bacterium]|nr:DJ-1/PfpI family protein [Candidatus Margulisiibacteriota bacterium]
MGEKPSASPDTKPKYKLEVLKMEVIPATLATSKAKELSDKKILMVIAPKNFHYGEFAKPKAKFEAQGIKVTVASSTDKTAVGMYGKKVKPDINIKNAKAADYDAVVFVGGTGSTVYKNDLNALSLVIEAKKNKKVIGAICLAPVILAKADIVDGKRTTVSSLGKHLMKKAGAICTGNKVEVDGLIVTGSGPDAAEEFAETIVKKL